MAWWTGQNFAIFTKVTVRPLHIPNGMQIADVQIDCETVQLMEFSTGYSGSCWRWRRIENINPWKLPQSMSVHWCLAESTEKHHSRNQSERVHLCQEHINLNRLFRAKYSTFREICTSGCSRQVWFALFCYVDEWSTLFPLRNLKYHSIITMTS